MLLIYIGVGKTSIAKSIARALDRKFYSFSVGGLSDAAEVKGHRRTYIGAMPGKPIQSLKSTGCLNPLILIDEIDKLGKSYNGDPASALLELLDPSQNSNFVDHYLDLPVDFSNVLFVCTANDESTIMGPLKDRMEVIRLIGYDTRDKVSIASKYLVPKALKEAGLISPKTADAAVDSAAVETVVASEEKKPTRSYEITDEALNALVKNYCRESGVRSLEKIIDKIARKLAFERVGKDEAAATAATAVATSETKDQISAEDQLTEKVVISTENLEKFVGKPVFTNDAIYDSKEGSLPAGVVMGLAWNPLGGSPIFIEAAAVPLSEEDASKAANRPLEVNVITGQLGSVMKESVNIAYTFARKFAAVLDAKNNFFRSNQLHVHVPEGAISKDGPSAGVAMATALIR